MPESSDIEFQVTALARGYGELSVAAKQAGESFTSLGNAINSSDLADSIAMAMKAYQAGLISVEDARAALEIDSPVGSTALSYVGVDVGAGSSRAVIHPPLVKQVKKERRLALDKNI